LPRKGHLTAFHIITKLREAEVLPTVGEASWKPGVTEQTYYRWRREYSGMDMRVEQAKDGPKAGGHKRFTQ